MALLGLWLLGFILLAVLLGPLLLPYGREAQDPLDALLNRMQPPSWAHPLGTDELGRDMLYRVLMGGRVSLFVGFMAMLVGIGLGTVLGAIAGYFGGFLDNFIMRLADTLIALPRLFVLIFLSVVIGTDLRTIVLVIGFMGWMGASRLVRAEILKLRETDYVEAARATGVLDARIIFRHILPNALSPVIVAATLRIAGAIITESSLSFLGLGIQPPTSSWGTLLRLAQDQLFEAPWLSIFPGLMIFLTVLSINFIGDGLRDALDPRRL